MDRPSQAKTRWPAPRYLVATFLLVYIAGWGYWLSLYKQTPSRKCSARLDGLAVDAKLAHLNHARRAAYDSLEAHLSSEGLHLGKEQTQGLDARTLFHKRDGRIEPGLQPLEVSVRAVVAPLGDTQASARLASAVREHIVPVAAEAGVWLQDPKKYHSTLFHASSHAHPVEASTAQIATETASVSKTAMALCPLEVVLERVIVTATGNVVACWQVAAGSDPSEVRRALERALPNAPARRYQTVQDPAILHTTLARLVQLQGRRTGRILRSGGLDQAAEIQSAAGRMTQALCGLALTLRSLWYVQEDDLLALALNGRSRHQEVPLLCQKPPPSLKGNVQSVHRPPPVVRDESYLERASHQG